MAKTNNMVAIATKICSNAQTNIKVENNKIVILSKGLSVKDSERIVKKIRKSFANSTKISFFETIDEEHYMDENCYNLRTIISLS